MHKRRCVCGVVSAAVAPHEATAAVVYGPNLRALAVYLLVFQHVPVDITRAKLRALVSGADALREGSAGEMRQTAPDRDNSKRTRFSECPPRPTGFPSSNVWSTIIGNTPTPRPFPKLVPLDHLLLPPTPA